LQVVTRRNDQVSVRNIVCNRVFFDQDWESTNCVFSWNTAFMQCTETQPFDCCNTTAGGNNFVTSNQCFNRFLTVRRSNTCAFQEASVCHGAAVKRDLRRIQTVSIETTNSNTQVIFKDQIAINILTTG